MLTCWGVLWLDALRVVSTELCLEPGRDANSTMQGARDRFVSWHSCRRRHSCRCGLILLRVLACWSMLRVVHRRVLTVRTVSAGRLAFTGVPVFTGGFVFTSGLVFAGMPLVGTVGTSLRTVLAWVAVVSIVIVTVLLVRVRAPVVPVLALVPGVLVMHTRDGTLSSWEAPCRPKTRVGTQPRWSGCGDRRGSPNELSQSGQ